MTMETAHLTWLTEIARDREKRRRYSASENPWRRGIIQNPTLVGLVGEFALSLFLSNRLRERVEINTRDEPRGDGGVDLPVYGIPIQVKTRTNRNDILIRRETDNGFILPIRWEVCVSVTWTEGDLVAMLDGWVRKSRMFEDADFVRGRRGSWMNLELGDEFLEPMGELPRYLKICKDMREMR